MTKYFLGHDENDVRDASFYTDLKNIQGDLAFQRNHKTIFPPRLYRVTIEELNDDGSVKVVES